MALRRTLALPVLLALMLGGIVATPASAAPCVRFSATNFDATGNDNYNLNGEWVRIKNYCSTGKAIGGWTIHDYNRIHVYRFPSTFSVAAGASVTLYSGSGTNTAAKRYWKQTYSAVWNNTPPEFAHLKNASGTLISKVTEY